MECNVIIKNSSLININDYGIYNYFKYNDCVYHSKMIAAISDNQYVISTGHCDESDHFGMHYDIEEKIGSYDCFLGSSGTELNVFAKESLTVNQINKLIDIFNELGLYYLDTGVNKKIRFMGTVFDNRFDNFKDCADIEKISRVLEDMLGQLEEKNGVCDLSTSSDDENFVDRLIGVMVNSVAILKTVGNDVKKKILTKK